MDVYVCGWSAVKNGLKVHVNGREDLSVEGATEDEACERLRDRIRDAGGAMGAVLEFVTPLPSRQGGRPFLVPYLLELAGNDFCDPDVFVAGGHEERFAAADRYFQAPLCRSCHHTSSARNKRPLLLTNTTSDDAALVRLPGGSRHIFSEQFLRLLTREERRRLRFRRVKFTTTRARRHFYELLGPVDVLFTGLKGQKPSGWRCGVCGFRLFGYWLKEPHIFNFVSAADLPSPLPTMFTVGDGSDRPNLCVTGDRWASLVGRPGTRGLSSSPIGVLSSAQVMRRFALPKRGATAAR